MKDAHLAENIRDLENLAQTLQRKGIKLTLITIPVDRSYGDGMDAIAYGRMQSALQKLCASNHLEYKNYSFDNRFTDTDFIDSNHLTLNGAKKFSRILREDVAAPQLRDLAQSPVSGPPPPH